MMEWFCGCLPTVRDRSAIQAFKPIEPVAMGSKLVGIGIGRNTSINSTNTMAFTETDRIKPIQLPSKDNGYVSVRELKKGAGDRTVFRKIRKSDYENIKEMCQKTNSKYTDDDFLHVNAVSATWKRLPDILPNATFMKEPINPNNIMQGLINDCYWMSGVASLADRDYRIKNLFGQLQLSPYGVYMCRLTYNGIYQEVVVDDYFPVDQKGKLVYAQPYMGTDCWMIILEKCWAKLFNSYQRIQWGFNCESLNTLGCAPVKTFYTQDFQYQQQEIKKLFRILEDHLTRHEVVTTSIQGKVGLKQELGIQVSHAYSVLGVYKTEVQGRHLELIQIRNPLGSHSGVIKQGVRIKNPSLSYGPTDPFWNKVGMQEKSRMNCHLMGKEGNGVFYMDFNQFMLVYSEVTICQIDDNSHYLYETASFANYEAKYINLQMDQFHSPFYLILTQQNKRKILSDKEIQSHKYASICVLVAKIEKDSRNRDTYTYISSKAYNHTLLTNYFPVDLGIRIEGHYIIRIEVRSPQNDAITNLTIGYYSPDDFQASFMAKIDDTQFLERVLLDRAKKMNEDTKTPLPNANGWCCIENIRGSNLCYIAYRINGISQYKKYKVIVDERKNKYGIHFLGSMTGKQEFNVEVPRGNDVIFIYMYTSCLEDPELVPDLTDDRQLPNPSFLPLQ